MASQKHHLPRLPYGYDALEPYIDAKTMKIHHTKHHQAYVDKLNVALEKHPELFDRTIERLLEDADQVPEDIRQAVINHGGGHANHSLFWKIMAPAAQGGGGEPSGNLAEAIDTAFGSLADLKQQFSDAALSRFGSGWAWLVVDEEGSLKVYSTANQDSPLMKRDIPILGIDVWEHGYYLKYQNRRADYVNAWWNVVDWEEVKRRYAGPRR